MLRFVTRGLKVVSGLPVAALGVIFGAAFWWTAVGMLLDVPSVAADAWDTFSADNTLDGEGAGQHWWDLAGVVGAPIGHALAAVIVAFLGTVILLVTLYVLCWAVGIDTGKPKQPAYTAVDGDAEAWAQSRGFTTLDLADEEQA